MPIVNPLYYVTFTTATLIASATLYAGFNTTDPVNTISLLAGFPVIFAGVYLLNLSRDDPHGQKLELTRQSVDVLGTDMISNLQTRLSIQSRQSHEPHNRSLSVSSLNGDREGLIRAYDLEAQVYGLTDIDEERNEDSRRGNGGMR